MASNCPVGTLKLCTNMEREVREGREDTRVSIRHREASPSMVRLSSRGKNSAVFDTFVLEVSRSLGAKCLSV